MNKTGPDSAEQQSTRSWDHGIGSENVKIDRAVRWASGRIDVVHDQVVSVGIEEAPRHAGTVNIIIICMVDAALLTSTTRVEVTPYRLSVAVDTPRHVHDT